MHNVFIIIVAFIAVSASAKIIHEEFHVEYMPGAPDGVHKKKILAVNGQVPGPTLEGEVGDTFVVVVHNHIQDGQNLSMHWHGIYHFGTPFDDGANMITQCPLAVNQSQTYTFVADIPGTYWYHSHLKSQYTEGMWGPLIIRAKDEVHEYDGEFVVVLNDWHHRTAHENDYWYISPLSTGSPPYPDSGLINGMGRYDCQFAQKRSFLKECSKELQKRPIFHVKSNAVYRVRLINTGSNTAFRFSIDHHKFEIIEADGVYTESQIVDEVVIYQAQRYSFLIRTDKVDIGSRFVIRADMATDLIRFNIRENVTPYHEALQPNATAILQYKSLNQHDPTAIITTESFNFEQTVPDRPIVGEFVTLNDLTLRPLDRIDAPKYSDVTIEIVPQYIYEESGIRVLTFNGVSFKIPEYPILMTVMEGGQVPAHVNPYIFKKNEVVDIVINSPLPGPHPFHLHGHTFWVLGTGPGKYNPDTDQLRMDGVRRETYALQASSWVVLRFVANNPGVWNFHCHNDWHNVIGMAGVFIVAPEEIQKFKVTYEARRVCSLVGIHLPE